MKIRELNEAIAKALNEKCSRANIIALKRRLKEDEDVTIDDIVDEVVKTIKNDYEGESFSEDELDAILTEEFDDYFTVSDDVIDLFKEIVDYNSSIYDDISDVLLSEMKGRAEDKLSDLIIDESLKPSKTDKKAMKESVNSIDSIVNSVVIKVNDSFDGTVDKDDLIHEFADDYLGNFDDVIDLFKEIHFNRSDLYDEILRSVSEEIEDRVREKLSDI